MVISYSFPVSDFEYFAFCCEVDQNSILDMFLSEHVERINNAFHDFVESHSQLKDLIYSEENEKKDFFYAVCFAYKTLLAKDIDKLFRSDKDSTMTYFAVLGLLGKIAENPYDPDLIEHLDKAIEIVLESVLEQLPQ